MSNAKRQRKSKALRRRQKRSGRRRTPAELRLDLRARAATLEELEEWQQYAAHIGLGAAVEHRLSDGTVLSSYQAVVVPNYEGQEDAWLAQLYERAKFRLRRGRLQEDGAALWFELEGPDGWVRIGRKVQMPIDTTGDP